jgi:glutamine synthetase
MQGVSDLAHAEAFLASNPSVNLVELLIADNFGVLRGKRISREKLTSVICDGALFPESVFGLDFSGDTIEATGLGVDRGDLDHVCRAVPASLVAVPWDSDGLGQLQMVMSGPDNGGFFADPRHVLATVVKHCTEAGVFPVTAMELEFYLLDADATKDGQPQAPIGATSTTRPHGTQVYGLEDLQDRAAVFDSILSAASCQNIPVDTIVAENAPSQFEVNLKHVADPLKAADHAVLLKRLIKGVARQHGLRATFMAKPFIDLAGNGAHVHISLLDGKGENLFQESADGIMSAYLQQAIAGLQVTMPESFALLMPTPNSYKRFDGQHYAPLHPQWGFNNRTTAFRIPAGPANARRVEHRVAGADANPYLVITAALTGILHGIAQQLQPTAAITGNGYNQAPFSRPDAAVLAANFSDAENITKYLPTGFKDVYLACLEAEQNRFRRHITAFEYDWYLGSA